jgi:glycosyltransferase involved in cell wall biosynthesis
MIMPGIAPGMDSTGVLRADDAQLRDATWWQCQQLDFVLFYGWGDPRYLDVARAIRTAGILLIQNLDAAGILTPYFDLKEWWVGTFGMIAGPQPVRQKLRLCGKAVRDFIPKIYEQKRLRMFEESDLLAAVSPPAASSIHHYISALGSNAASKLVVLPHPVIPRMYYDGRSKEKRVVCVGRWLREDWHQKDPQMMLDALSVFLDRNPDWEAEVIGRGSSALQELIRPRTGLSLQRVTFTERLGREELVERYLGAKILFCPSRFESYHISSAEALCCGCSVVVADHPLLASTGWFTTRGSGTSAHRRSFSALAAALSTEASQWEAGERSPRDISEEWCGILHSRSVASQLLKLVRGTVLDSEVLPPVPNASGT